MVVALALHGGESNKDRITEPRGPWHTVRQRLFAVVESSCVLLLLLSLSRTCAHRDRLGGAVCHLIRCTGSTARPSVTGPAADQPRPGRRVSNSRFSLGPGVLLEHSSVASWPPDSQLVLPPPLTLGSHRSWICHFLGFLQSLVARQFKT